MTIPVTPAMTDAALDRWLKGPEWRNSIFADRDRTGMRAALTAALVVSGFGGVVEALREVLPMAENYFDQHLMTKPERIPEIMRARAALAKVAQP